MPYLVIISNLLSNRNYKIPDDVCRIQGHKKFVSFISRRLKKTKQTFTILLVLEQLTKAFFYDKA